MPQAAPVIAAVVGVAGAYMSYKSQSEAASAQKDAARESQRLAELNAQNQERETAQQAENLKKAQSKEQAANRAKAAASGVAYDPLDEQGSFGLVLEDQRKTHGEELGWLKQSGASQADIIRRGGQAAYDTGMAKADTYKYGSYGSLIGGIGSAYDGGSEIYDYGTKNWGWG